MLTVPVLQNSQSTEYRILLTFSQLKLNVCLLLIVGLLFNDSNYLKLLKHALYAVIFYLLVKKHVIIPRD